jgi:hypothetical protein
LAKSLKAPLQPIKAGVEEYSCHHCHMGSVIRGIMMQASLGIKARLYSDKN